ELVAPPLDARVLARSLAAGDRQVVRDVAADGERRTRAVHRELVLAALEQKARFTGAFGHRGLLGSEGIAGAAAPAELDDLDLAAPALHAAAVERAGAAAKARAHGGKTARIGEDLSGAGELHQPCRDVHAVAEDVATVLDHGARMQADA